MSCHRQPALHVRALRRASLGLAAVTGATLAIAGLGAAPASAATSGGAVVSEAASLAGSPYLWGGTSPSGFDCSGYVGYVFAHVGISLPRTAQEQYDAVAHIPTSAAQPGDIVFFYDSSGYIYHDGIYAGSGMMWDSAEPGTVVAERTIWTSSYYIGRPAGTVSAPSPVSYEPSPSSSLLEEGSTGSAVVTLQQLLHITADGDFGPQTLAAVMAFQRTHGLTVDGVVGPLTWGALRGSGSVVTVAYHPSATGQPLLEEGSTGAAVEVVQRAVHVSVDGDFGPITRAGVMAFQQAHGLTVDGIVGPQTWGAIDGAV